MRPPLLRCGGSLRCRVCCRPVRCRRRRRLLVESARRAVLCVPYRCPEAPCRVASVRRAFSARVSCGCRLGALGLHSHLLEHLLVHRLVYERHLAAATQRAAVATLRPRLFSRCRCPRRGRPNAAVSDIDPLARLAEQLVASHQAPPQPVGRGGRVASHNDLFAAPPSLRLHRRPSAAVRGRCCSELCLLRVLAQPHLPVIHAVRRSVDERPALQPQPRVWSRVRIQLRRLQQR